MLSNHYSESSSDDVETPFNILAFLENLLMDIYSRFCSFSVAAYHHSFFVGNLETLHKISRTDVQSVF